MLSRWYFCGVRDLVSVFILTALLVGGCAHKKAAPQEGLIVTPGKDLIGRVVRVNTGARVVVITFPAGRFPAADQHLMLYRNGARVGEVRITGPRLDEDVAGDLVSGEARVGDEARE